MELFQSQCYLSEPKINEYPFINIHTMLLNPLIWRAEAHAKSRDLKA